VVVVEDQHHVARAGVEVVEDRGEDRLDRWLGRPQ